MEGGSPVVATEVELQKRIHTKLLKSHQKLMKESIRRVMEVKAEAAKAKQTAGAMRAGVPPGFRPTLFWMPLYLALIWCEFSEKLNRP